jgi:hypothetical protein
MRGTFQIRESLPNRDDCRKMRANFIVSLPTPSGGLRVLRDSVVPYSNCSARAFAMAADERRASFDQLDVGSRTITVR